MAKSHWYDPQGADKVRLQTGVYADSSSAGVWISGHGAPPSGSGLLPLDGVNDPWRWMPSMSGWVGPAYQLTLTGAEEIAPSALPNPEGTNPQQGPLVAFAAIAADTAVGYTSAPALFADHYLDGFSGQGEGQLEPTLYWADPSETPRRTLKAVGPTTGIVFLAQYEAGFGGPTSPPFPDLDVRDVLTGLGLTVGAPFEFSESAPLGADGQFYLDLDSRDVHLRMNGAWSKVATLPAPS